MFNSLIKTIGLVCLGISSLCLVGCFHVPDKDWLPSRNKVKTEEVKNNEVEQAITSFIDGVNMISSEWNEMKNNEENVEIEESEEIIDVVVEDEVIDNENNKSSLEGVLDSLE